MPKSDTRMLLIFFMLPTHSLVADPEHLMQKFAKYLELIKTARSVAFKPAENTSVCTNATASHLLPSKESSYEWKEFNESYEFGKQKYKWFAFKGVVSAPEEYDPEKHFMHLEFKVDRNYNERTWDDNSPAGPEGRMWLNGKPLAAIDEFHSGSVVKETGELEARIFSGRCWTSHVLSKFGIEIYHKDTEALYQRLRFMISFIKQLEDSNDDKPKLIRILDECVRLLDIRNLNFPIALHNIRNHDKNNTAFYKSVPAALQKLKEGFKQFPQYTDNDPMISVIGYSHIDTCWLWPFSFTHFKSANTAIGMLHLMENPPHEFEKDGIQWKFLATAAQHYKWMKQDSPEIYEKVMKAVKDGRWDVNGVAWVEPDTNNPSGESLVRQVVMGTRYLEKETNKKQTVMVLPDCFGFSANFPQILKSAGIDSFLTSKISWCEYTKFPYSTFRWKGIDGSDVFTHFITTPSSWSYQTATYTGVSTAYEMIGTYNAYKQKDILPHSAIHTSGNGDGGGGITEEMVWNLNLMAELPKIKDVPHPLFPDLESIFVDIRKQKDLLPVWDDELYLEYHRGTYTTQEEVKRQNRLLESNLHSCEWLLTILSSLFKYPTAEVTAQLESIWEDTLLFHFHDAIPGSSINEANEDIILSGQPLLAKLKEIEDKLTAEITKKIRTPTSEKPEIIFNTLSHDRSINGQVIPSGGWTVKKESTKLSIDEIETTTYEMTYSDDYNVHKLKTSFIDPVVKSNVSINKESKIVKTPFLEIKFGDNGSIDSVRDLKTGREFLSAPGNQFELYEDRPIAWPAWDIQLYHKEMPNDPPVFDGYEFTDDSVITKWHIKRIGDGEAETSTINQTITFSSESPVIDFKTIVNWTQHDKLLKVAFPTTIRSRSARFGIQFGHIERPTHSNTRRDMAKFETYGRWCDLSEQSNGISIASDVKSGWDVHEGMMRLSLLKAPMQTDKWADFGIRKFTYRVAFHNGGFDESNVVALSDELITPVLAAPYIQPATPATSDSVPHTAEFVVINDDKIILETLKPAYDVDGFVARVYESAGGWRRTTIKFPLLDSAKWEAIPVDLHEKPINGSKYLKKLEAPQLTIQVELGAFKLVSILFKRIE